MRCFGPVLRGGRNTAKHLESFWKRLGQKVLWRFHGLIKRGFLPSPPQRWVVSRQMRFEGGFQGRCNKLVDGCYSFWQAGLLPLLHRAFFKEGTSKRELLLLLHDDTGQKPLPVTEMLPCLCRRVGVESAAVDDWPAGLAGVHPPVLSEPNRGAPGQAWQVSTTRHVARSTLSRCISYSHPCIVCSCAFRSRDFYHTCYCLSGLSIAQHFGNVDLHHEMILGSEDNRLVRLQRGRGGRGGVETQCRQTYGSASERL